MRLRYSTFLALASALVLCSAGTSLATTFSYVATLSGLSEVGPNASPATGSAFFVYDDVANTLTTSASFSGLLAPATASHIHGPAGVGVNAAVIHPFVVAAVTSGTISDLWSGLTPVQVGYLNSSLLYINIHTSVFPGGEIRGQIVPEASTPTRSASWGKIKALYR